MPSAGTRAGTAANRRFTFLAVVRHVCQKVSEPAAGPFCHALAPRHSCPIRNVIGHNSASQRGGRERQCCAVMRASIRLDGPALEAAHRDEHQERSESHNAVDGQHGWQARSQDQRMTRAGDDQPGQHSGAPSFGGQP